MNSHRNRYLPWILVAFIPLVLSNVIRGSEPSPDRPLPNIILILADDLGYGDVEFLNPESRIPTPHLNQLASEGITFTRAHAPAAVCTPTRYSLLTGNYPWRSRLKMGVLWIWDPPLIDRGILTLGEVLQRRGYHTACIGKWHLGWNWPTGKGGAPDPDNQGRDVNYRERIGGGPTELGFDYYFGDDVPGFPPHAFIENDRMVELPTAWHDTPPGAPGAMSPGWDYTELLPAIASRAARYIQSQISGEPEKPFFLYFSLTAPHTPIAPAEPFLGKSEAGRYGDFVYQVDYSVGNVIRILDSLKIRQNTLIIFASDNGAIPLDGENYAGEFGSLYRFGHSPNGALKGVKSDAWEGGHRIPMIASWPGMIQFGRYSEELISLTDLMATLAALTGFTLPDSTAVDSHNMLPLLLDSSSVSPRKTLVAQSGNGILSMQRGPWKLIMSSGSGGSWSRPAGEFPYREDSGKGNWKNVQLYQLVADPGEAINLAGRMPGKVNELVSLLAGEILEGRSNQGPSFRSTPPCLWEQVNWLNEMNP